jgi:hypothetical protein
MRDKKFNTKVGLIATLKVHTWALEQDYDSNLACEGAPYDLVVNRGSGMETWDVKIGSFKKDHTFGIGGGGCNEFSADFIVALLPIGYLYIIPRTAIDASRATDINVGGKYEQYRVPATLSLARKEEINDSIAAR